MNCNLLRREDFPSPIHPITITVLKSDSLTISNLIGFIGGVLGAAFVLDLHKMIGLSDYFFYGI